MQRVLKSLQTAFAHMDASCVGVYDIGDFIRLLGLPTNVQQDAEEFAKLFLEKLVKWKIERSTAGMYVCMWGDGGKLTRHIPSLGLIVYNNNVWLRT